MNALTKRRTPRAGGVRRDTGKQAPLNFNTSRPFLVIAINRHGRRVPAGRFDSLAVAERNASLLRKPARRFTVLCVKSSGAHVKFQTYSTLAEAEAVVKQLQCVGCQAVVKVTP